MPKDTPKKKKPADGENEEDKNEEPGDAELEEDDLEDMAEDDEDGAADWTAEE